MSEGMNLFVYPVNDLAKAKALYSTLLGVKPYADAAYYVGFRVGGRELGLDPSGHDKGMSGPIGYIEVSDIRQSLRSLLDAGVQLQQDVHEVGREKLMAWVKDADNNMTGLLQPK